MCISKQLYILPQRRPTQCCLQKYLPASRSFHEAFETKTTPRFSFCFLPRMCELWNVFILLTTMMCAQIFFLTTALISEKFSFFLQTELITIFIFLSFSYLFQFFRHETADTWSSGKNRFINSNALDKSTFSRDSTAIWQNQDREKELHFIILTIITLFRHIGLKSARLQYLVFCL